MNDHVYWILELDVHPGRDDDFRALMADMVDATQRNEPNTLDYEWSTSADGRVCRIYERYADSAAVITHVKGALAGLDPVYMRPAAGFSR